MSPRKTAAAEPTVKAPKLTRSLIVTNIARIQRERCNGGLRKSASVREQLQASDLLDKARLIDVETVRRFLKLNASDRALVNDLVCSIIEAPKVKTPQKKRAGAK